MIFVTVGSIFPFDRLVRAMDVWTAEAGGEDVLAQIGDGAFEPPHMRWLRRLEREAFDDTVRQARLVVAHAGIGSVITAGSLGRPIVVLPRRRHLGEHTSDHQLETVIWLRKKTGVYVAETERELGHGIAEALAAPTGAAISQAASPALLAQLRTFIKASPPRRRTGP